MKLKNYFFVALCTIFAGMTYAQRIVPNEPTKASYVGTITPVYVPSIASRMNELVPADRSQKEAKDRRSLAPKVVIGKDKQTEDDYFVRNRNEMEQSIRVMPPSLVFDAYSSGSMPTDPSLAVGPDHVFVVFNTGFTIYDKNGNELLGQTSPNPAIFPSSGCCDLTVSYDNAADRWVVSFLGSGAQIAVSDGPDPINDGWNVYNIPQINDYQKLSVWSDGYYLTDNANSNRAWAMERDEMLLGNTAGIQGFPLPGIFEGPAGFTGPQVLNVSDGNMPADGGATFMYQQDDAYTGVSSDHMKVWTLDVDWVTPGNSVMSAATEIPLTPFIGVFDGGSFVNLAQPGGGGSLDALQQLIGNQAQFRKFGTHNSAVFSFVVDLDGTAGKLAGLRWMELRQTADNQPWTLFQEGTYQAPDGRHAWNGSMVMDGNGNIAMGYTSMSGPTTPTTVRVSSYYTGRFDGDPLGTMTVTEELIANGSTNIPGTRYGDYSKIDIDPSDDATFWFIDEYMNGTRKGVVGAFQLQPNTTTDDIGVTSIDEPVDGVLTNAEDITISIRNFGINDIVDPEVQYTIDAGTPVVETYSGTITAGTTVSYTFATQADLSTPGTYTITSRTNLTGDTEPGNDEATKDVTNGIILCIPMANSGCNVDGIKKFVLNTIDADDGGDGCNTEPGTSPQGYADRTALSTTLMNVSGNNVYTLQAQQNWTGGPGVEALSVWIDFNDDGTFDASERLISGEFFQDFGVLEDFTLTIPVGAALGSHILRAKAIDTSAAGDILDPCTDFDFGEVQDYTVVIDGIAGFENPDITAADLIVTSLPNNQFQVTLVTNFSERASIGIYDIAGRLLAFNFLEKQGDRFVYNLDMSYAASGVYLIQMGDPDSKTYQTAKIVVK